MQLSPRLPEPAQDTALDIEVRDINSNIKAEDETESNAQKAKTMTLSFQEQSDSFIN